MTARVPRADQDRGFTLAEALVGILLLGVLAGSVAGVIAMQTRTASAQPEAVDVQQRARFALDTIASALRAAGAGMDYGPASGPLRQYLPPVLPRRIGATGADAWSTARANAISIVTMPSSSVQTTLREPITSAADPLVPNVVATCIPGDVLCGLRIDMPVMVFDSRARFSLMTVASLLPDRAHVTYWHPASPLDYSPGAAVSRVEVSIFHFDGSVGQVRVSDGDGSDVPLIDNAVGLSFEYFGDPEPPMSPKPPAGLDNCLYDTAGVRVGAVTLAPGGRVLVPLPLTLFADGPWCGTGHLRFDADLLRVRSVRATVRVQTAAIMSRGRGAQYAAPGLGRAALSLVPDLSMTIDVAPRNMQGGR